jgi:2-succinyl-6-hydroxy-2,4-cyclohexadiene-1-carboxylate synthase
MTRVVALHGFLGQPDDWNGVRSALHELAPRVVFEAIPLAFRSASRLPETTAAWAREFSRSQHTRRVARNVLIGHSLGGRLALQAALDQPGLWDEVVLVSSHPGCADAREKAQRLEADAQWAARFGSRPWGETIEAWNRQTVFAGSREPERREHDYDKAALAHVLRNWSPALDVVSAQAMRGLEPKLHWYAGANDAKYLELYRCLRSAGLIGGFHVIRDAGHRVIFDEPRELARQLVVGLKL